jgi:hypothetical protein
MFEPNNLCEHPRCTICGLTLEYQQWDVNISPMPIMYIFKTACEHKELAIFDLDGNKVIQRKVTKTCM